MTDVQRKLGEAAAKLAAASSNSPQTEIIIMEPQQTPQAPSEPQIGLKVMTVTKPGPAVAPLSAPQQQLPPGGPQGPRFPSPINNGSPQQQPAQGPPRFPPDNRAQLFNPSQQQQQQPRPTFNGPAPQRAPPPRNVFFGRPPQPAAAPGAAPLPPPRFPPPPSPAGTGGFPTPPGVRPPVVPYGQPGFPPRPSYPGGEPSRPKPPLQRAESLGADNRPRGPPGPQQPQTLEGRRARFGPSLSVESVAEVEVHQAASRPMSAVSEDTTVGAPEAKVLAARPPTGKNVVERQQSNEDKQQQQSVVKSINNVNGDVVKAEKKIEQTPTTTPAPPASSSDHGIKGFDDGVRKSLTTPPPPLPPTITTTTTTTGGPTQETNDVVAQKKKKMTVELDATRDTADDERLSKERGIASAKGLVKPAGEAKAVKKAQKSDVENDSGVDESTQRREIPRANGLATKKARDLEKRSMSCSPVKTPNKSLRSPLKTPDAAAPASALDGKKKLPMNKVQVGAAPSPNLKAVRSKIGSLQNATHKPGGGNIKIENKKLDFSGAQPRIAAKNDSYAPHGGDKKIQQVKLQWNAKSKIGSLENTSYKPGGGDKKIESIKLDFKDKAKPKVGSKDNTKHVPGGGTVKTPSTSKKAPARTSATDENIETHKVEVKAESKIGSLDNVKHKPGGGDKKIFDDKTYLRQTSSSHGGSVSGSVGGSGTQSPVPSGRTVDKNGLPISDENLNQER